MKQKLILGLVLALASSVVLGCSEEQKPVASQSEVKQEVVNQQADAVALEQGRAMLEGIHRGVQPGTAGCSLKLLQTTVRTYHWAQATNLTPQQIKKLRADYVAALTPEEAQLFSRQLEDVAWEYGNFLDPKKATSNAARLYDVNMSSKDIAFPVERVEVMDALLEE